ncbi:hypothetical protein D9M69_673770 [compost metagenome]
MHLDDLRANGYSLGFNKYFAPAQDPEIFDLQWLIRDGAEIKAAMNETTSSINALIADLISRDNA